MPTKPNETQTDRIERNGAATVRATTDLAEGLNIQNRIRADYNEATLEKMQLLRKDVEKRFDDQDAMILIILGRLGEDPKTPSKPKLPIVDDDLPGEETASEELSKKQPTTDGKILTFAPPPMHLRKSHVLAAWAWIWARVRLPLLGALISYWLWLSAKLGIEHVGK